MRSRAWIGFAIPSGCQCGLADRWIPSADPTENPAIGAAGLARGRRSGRSYLGIRVCPQGLPSRGIGSMNLLAHIIALQLGLREPCVRRSTPSVRALRLAGHPKAGIFGLALAHTGIGAKQGRDLSSCRLLPSKWECHRSGLVVVNDMTRRIGLEKPPLALASDPCSVERKVM